VSAILDHLAASRGGVHTITASERARLEWRWLRHKVSVPQS